MALETEQQHFAFISYGDNEKHFAEELESYLKHYRVPRSLRKKKPWLPQKFHGICLDKRTLPPGRDYLQSLPKEVNCSKFLIVICSKSSAVPNAEGHHYVNDLVEHFLIKPENRKRLIPIILREKVKGISSGSLNAYMPPVMHGHKFHAADVGTQGKDRAFSDVAAALLELRSAEDLWNDLEREQTAKQRKNRIAAGVLAVAAVAGGYMAWDYYAPHTSYYADYVECNDIPVGINALTKEQIAARHSHYRFTERMRKVVRVSHCNSAGTPVVHDDTWETDRPVTMTLEYNTQGKVSKRTHEDTHGVQKLVWNFHESGTYVNFETLEGQGLASVSSFVSTWAISHNEKRKKNEVVRFDFKRDAQGHVVQELYKNPYTEPTEDENGVGGRDYERNDKGQITRVQYLDKAGKPLAASLGAGGYKLVRNDAGEVIKMISTGADGNSPALNERKWAVMEVKRDPATSNIVEANYLDTQGKPCQNAFGFAKALYQYDARGNWAEGAYFDADGNPCPHKNGYAKVMRSYDTRGNSVETAYLGTDGKPCLHADGYAKVMCQYDAHGNMTEQAFFGVDDKPCLCKDGFAKMRVERSGQGGSGKMILYDTQGNILQEKDLTAK